MKDKIQQIVLDNLREFSTPDRPVYLVGGAVRDTLTGSAVHDLDFILPGETRKLANELACRLGGALYMLDEERNTTRVVLDLEGHRRMLVDFASLRGPDLESDLRARDFTINAMAFDVAAPNHLIDPLGGLAHLRGKQLHACLPDSLSSDPVRVLRAVRQALSFGLRIDPDTFHLMQAAAPLLTQVSAERIRDELFRMLDGQRVDLAIRLLDQAGALRFVLPELDRLKDVTQSAPHVLDAWEHTLSVVRSLEQLLAALVGDYAETSVGDLTVGSAVLWLGRYRQQLAEHYHQSLVTERSLRALLFFAALYHDIAKPETRTQTREGRIRFLGHDAQGAKTAAQRARALALSTAEVERSAMIVEHHMRVHQLANNLGGEPLIDGEQKISRRSIYRYYKDSGAAGIDICLLALADVRGTYGFTLPQDAWEKELRACRALFEAYWEKSEEVVSPPRYLSGKDLMREFNLKPGPAMGHLLNAIREAQAAGEITDPDEALAYASRWIDLHSEEFSSKG